MKASAVAGSALIFGFGISYEPSATPSPWHVTQSMSLYFFSSNATKIAFDFGITSRFMNSTRWSRFMSFHAAGAGAGVAAGFDEDPQAARRTRASFFMV